MILNTTFKREDMILTVSKNQNQYVNDLYEKIIIKFDETILIPANQKN